MRQAWGRRRNMLLTAMEPNSQPRRDHPPGRLRRERRGRGLRGVLAPRSVPISQSRSQAFDVMVLAAVEHLRPHVGDRLDGIEFAVEEVPQLGDSSGDAVSLDDDILDDNSVPLSRLYRAGLAGIAAPVVVVYRRPLEARARHREDLPDLVHDVVVEQIARLLNVSPDDIDPPPDN